MENKERYLQVCEQYADIPVFMQPWWMDAVCAGKQWDVLLSTDENGEVRAAMPYLIRKRFWMRYVIMPQQTQINGIWLRWDMRENLMLVKEICQDFAAQLKAMKLSYYYQQYPIGSPCPQIMKTLGFKVKERTTYRIDDLTDLNKLINTFSKNKKRQLQKALALHADTQMTAEEFYQFHTDCLEQRGKKISYTREDFLVLYQKATRQQQGVILSVRDQQQEPLAAVFLVWDKRTLYYLIPCFSEDKKETGASALLAWEAIKQAEARQLQFDFEGSMNRGIANHYKQFASTPTAYFAVRKYYRPMFALFKLFYSLKK